MQSALTIQAAAHPVALRDVAALMFRHKRLLTGSFFAIVCLGLCTALLMPRNYESTAKLLVERERVDTVISPERSAGYQAPSEEVGEAELNSEMELLRTNDILRTVVLRNGLAGDNPSPLKIDQAVMRLSTSLHIEPINKSNIIGVTYRSTSPQLAAKVLNTLTALFLVKHLRVRRASGQYEFFDGQAQRYKEQLAQIEKQLASLRVVSPALARDKTVDKLIDLKAAASETDAAVAETERRIASLQDLEIHTPNRVITEKRTSDNPQLLQNLKGTLLALELDRDQLLAKFQPTYRPVLDLERKIADTKAAIAAEESEPVREETTNQSTAFEWIGTERAKAEAELQGLRGRQSAGAQIVSAYEQELRNLNRNGLQEEDLLREQRTAEANYALYSQKREEARISEDLDRRKILNVVVVQNAFVPAVHVRRRKKIATAGGIAAVMLSLGVVLIADFFDPKFRTLHEAAAFLDVPVLAAIPSSYELSRLRAGVREKDQSA